MPFFFDFLYLCAAVTAGPIFLLRRLRSRKPLAPMRARLFDFPRSAPGEKIIWIHGVSVGEILAARGLSEGLGRSLPDHRIVFSTTTPAGFEVAKREYPEASVFYCPLDFGRAVRRAIQRVAPRFVVLMELELWPNLLHYLHEADIPVVVANGKMSKNSYRGYRRFLRLAPRFFDGVSRFCVQNETYGDRLRGLGVPAERIRVTGSIKVDNLPARPESDARGRLRAELDLGDAPVLLAGSTHDGEESQILSAYQTLKRGFPNLRLIVAPRHAERVKAVEDEARGLGLSTRRRSDTGSSTLNDSVILVDTMGELAQLYAVADVVFLGGSLVPVGGHNVLEPAAQGRVTLVGPYVWTVKGFVEELVQEGAARTVSGVEELVVEIQRLLDDAEHRAAAGLAAAAVVDRHRGATERTIKQLREMLASRGGREFAAVETAATERA